ncbi:predicted protein [Histoplasma capsulatum G186AR]|uniref:Uncharacterized protein n=1 Tax=Ajellomyces capsulatus (strain G186AR / H82 / ATCC MYA-2454 / RMSCC 2432) TaxID=447093 RepID=C0NAC8_AJECG|nr:uncharacterized protein HCBG_00074 [Histoplasma capsulatum G186AR]EEH10619.1 predicted protein [Histoplasma capsulatum G186AR]
MKTQSGTNILQLSFLESPEAGVTSMRIRHCGGLEGRNQPLLHDQRNLKNSDNHDVILRSQISSGLLVFLDAVGRRTIDCSYTKQLVILPLGFRKFDSSNRYI